MIPERVARTIEHLVPVIERHDLAVSGLTAADMYALTVQRSDTNLQLTSADVVAPRQRCEIGEELRAEVVALRDGGRFGHAPSSQHAPVGLLERDDRLVVTLADPTDHLELAIEVIVDDPSIQPAITRRTPVRPGEMRIATIDQTAVARQSLDRWAARPSSLSAAADVGLAAHRVGPHHLLTDRSLTGSEVDRLHGAVEALGREVRHHGIPPEAVRRAVDGLHGLQARLAEDLQLSRARIRR